MLTLPSGSCHAAGITTPTVFLSAAMTSGFVTTCLKCGEPISSSPSTTRTMFTGTFLPAPLIACSAARNAASGPFWLTAPRPSAAMDGFLTQFWKRAMLSSCRFSISDWIGESSPVRSEGAARVVATFASYVRHGRAAPDLAELHAALAVRRVVGIAVVDQD